MTKPKRKLADLAPAEDNPREISPEALASLGRSMDEFGDLSGVTFNRRSGKLIGGHQRMQHIPARSKIQILRKFHPPTERGTVAFGVIEADGEFWWYREVDVDEVAERTMNVSANKQGGGFNDPALEVYLSFIDEGGGDVGLAGFTKADLEGLRTAYSQSFADSLGALPKGGRADIQQVAFILTSAQADRLREALKRAKAEGPFQDEGNQNSNGNAIMRIADSYSPG